uniref:Ovule protein n=1 Tax=Parascaris univalens TaxID=6257 RepID=A0A914ZSB7_PARUN
FMLEGFCGFLYCLSLLIYVAIVLLFFFQTFWPRNPSTIVSNSGSVFPLKTCKFLEV